MNSAGRRQPLRPSGASPIDVDDIVHSGSDDDYYDSPNERRRRYEIQTQRFLQGRPVTIISAQLRGPFEQESGWQNPWLGKSRANNGTKDTTATPIAPAFTGDIDGREFGRAHVPLAPLKIDRLTQPSSCHLPSPVSSSSYGATINPYMDGTAWSRVHSWRFDVAAKAEELQATATPSLKTPGQATSRSKRPASSELLRNALAKRSRFNGLGLSIGQPLSTAGQNHSPRTDQRHVSDNLFSTPDNQSLRNSHVGPENFSEAALDGSVTGQTSISKQAQAYVSSAGNSVEWDGFSTPTPIPVVSGAGKVNGLPVTPVRQSRPLPNGQHSCVVSKASSPERSPLRPNVLKINGLIYSLTQDSKKSQAAKEIGQSGVSVTVTGAQEASPLDFCTQADRSFQYRSKAPRVNKSRGLIEATCTQKALSAENAESDSQSSSSVETASENTEPPPEDVPNEGSEEVYSPGTFAAQNKIALLEDRKSASSTTDDTSILAEEAADTTTPGIDGPTLIPTSSAPSQQQQRPAPPSAPRCKKVDVAEGQIRRNAIDNGDCALPEFESNSNPDTPPNKLIQVLSPGPPVGFEAAKLIAQIHDTEDVQISEENLDGAVDAAILPTSQPFLGSRVDGGGEVETQDKTPSSDQGATIKWASGPKSNAVRFSPQQQSPWAKEVVHITEASPHPKSKPPTQQTPILETVRPGPNKTPRDSEPAVTPVQQSPWTKEIILPARVDTVADMPSGRLVDYTKQVLRHTGATGMTGSQNPWILDNNPADANYLRAGDSRPLFPQSSHRLHRTDGATSSFPVLTEHSTVRQTADMATGEAPTKHPSPSTPTQQSSLPTPDLTSSIKSFRDFMSPSPEPRRRSKPVLSSKPARVDKLQRRKSALSNSRKDRAKRAHLRVSFTLPGEGASSSPATNTDPDQTLEGAELPSREAESPSLVRKASGQAPSRRASSPPLELSQSELPQEGARFSKFFRVQARKGPQVRRPGNYKPLLPSASQQTCGSPQVDAMAEAFIEADRTRRDSADSSEKEEEGEQGFDTRETSPEAEETQEIDDVTAVLDNLGDYLNSFDVDAELDKARREKQDHEMPQEMGLGFPSTQDQMEIMGAGVWD
jgi:hypothetical protein